MTYGARQYGSGSRVISAVVATPIIPETATTGFATPVTAYSRYSAAVLTDSPYAYYRLGEPVKLVGATFDPASVANLVAWLNPATLGVADGATVTSAPALSGQSAWVAQSGGGVTYKASGINGRPYVQTVSTSNKGLYYPANFRTTACTIFGVAKIRTGGVASRVFSAQTNNWLMGWHGGQEDRGYFEGWTYGETTVGTGQVSGPLDTNQLRAYSVRFDTSTYGLMRRNNQALPQNTGTGGGAIGPQNFSINGFGAGNGGSGTEFSDADVYEVLIYNRALTDGECSQIADYLGAKYGTFSAVSSLATTADSSGNGRTASISDYLVTSFIPGQPPLLDRGFAGSFSTSRFAVVQAPFTTAFPAFTMEALVRPEGASVNGRVFSKVSYFATATTDFPFSVDHTTANKFVVQLDSGNDFTADSITTSSGTYARDATYHLVVVVRNSGTCELWVNGTLDTSWSITFDLVAGSRAWTLGGNSFENGGGVGGLRFQGRLSHWAIYNSALTSTRIQAHYAAMAPGSTSAALVGYWESH